MIPATKTFLPQIIGYREVLNKTWVNNWISNQRELVLEEILTSYLSAMLNDVVELSFGVNLSGNCQTGAHTQIGINAILSPRIKIGSNRIVGAGAVITKNVRHNAMVAGFSVIIKNQL